MTIKIGSNGREDASMIAIKKGVDSNQVRLQTLELAVAHLTNICIGLAEEVGSLKSALLECNAIRGDEEQAVIDMKLSYYSNSSSPCSNSKYDLAIKGVGRQTGNKPLALPRKKDDKASSAIKVQGAGSKPKAIVVKANPKASIKAAATTTTQKASARSNKATLIKNNTPTKTNPSTVKSSAIQTVTTKTKASPQATMKVKTETSRNSGSVTKKPANKAGNKSPAPVTVKMPLQMADAPTIRSLIYGSRTISAVKSHDKTVPIITKKTRLR